jgi:hypothetical protein
LARSTSSSIAIRRFAVPVLDASSSFRASAGFRGAFQRLADEIHELVCALLNPRKIVAEVHEMRALQLEAQRIDATQPVRAELLRRRASRIGLR